jgi:RNA polymerase sigma factor (sigma-70 family)
MIMLGGGSTDRELLDQYVHEQDAAAFRDLVSRHGSVVHRVCRDVLKDTHDAEDAFQATFLVLARRATEIREPEALGGWLRGVAYRVAIRARRRAARRREIEKARAEMSRDDPAAMPDEPACELKELVGDELTRLPDDYRRPIVLCYLDGLTHQEAARRLDWPVGTVKIRLVRGRRMLRERLNRRGVALGAGLLVMLPMSRRACAVTEPLVESTARAMSLESAGRHAALKSEYPRVRELAGGAGRLGLLAGARWLWAALVVVAVTMTLAGPIAQALGGPPVSEVDPSTLPGNLTDVLSVECR